jgi:hypothetical protein
MNWAFNPPVMLTQFLTEVMIQSTLLKRDFVMILIQVDSHQRLKALLKNRTFCSDVK